MHECFYISHPYLSVRIQKIYWRICMQLFRRLISIIGMFSLNNPLFLCFSKGQKDTKHLCDYVFLLYCDDLDIKCWMIDSWFSIFVYYFVLLELLFTWTLLYFLFLLSRKKCYYNRMLCITILSSWTNRSMWWRGGRIS